MAELKIRTRTTGALAVLPPGGLPSITTPTGGTLDVVTQVSAPGFNPLDLLYASLAACMVLSARIAATRLGVADRLGEVSADVGGEKAKDEPSRVETFTVKLEITGDLDLYRDLYHFAPQVNRWIVARTCGNADSEDAGNVERFERELRMQLATWRPPRETGSAVTAAGTGAHVNEK